jgi:hypothetical protein
MSANYEKVDQTDIPEATTSQLLPSNGDDDEIIEMEPTEEEQAVINALKHPTLYSVHDGVFANIPAKPDTDDKEAELPPPYDSAVQDIVPPYFDTTIITSDDPDEVMIEGLTVGSSFSFVWNMMISMTFQFVGFLLTYLLHTSHAAKNGSKAGLGITLIQYGLYMRSKDFRDDEYAYYSAEGDGSTAAEKAAEAAADSDAEWARTSVVSFLLMIVGWFLVIRATSEYIRIRRILAVILTTPDGAV